MPSIFSFVSEAISSQSVLCNEKSFKEALKCIVTICSKCGNKEKYEIDEAKDRGLNWGLDILLGILTYNNFPNLDQQNDHTSNEDYPEDSMMYALGFDGTNQNFSITNLILANRKGNQTYNAQSH